MPFFTHIKRFLPESSTIGWEMLTLHSIEIGIENHESSAILPIQTRQYIRRHTNKQEKGTGF